jgi:glycosyltransferase involved in cell wall biosynthesis
VLFVGRDGLEKGVDLVIDVAKFSGFDFDIIGCNQLEGRSLPPNVRNHGPLIWSDIEILLKGARCLIFPSRTIEADGLVLREVGVFGVPAIISNSVLKANELFASGSSLLFEVGSVMSLWTQLSRLEDDEVVRGLSQSTWEAYSDIRHKDEPS